MCLLLRAFALMGRSISINRWRGDGASVLDSDSLGFRESLLC